ncbi:hypothetical protein MUY27_20000 [Mucilaginibacter sp. RS28]|uniref:DUF3078 domain-containing protein n=1 Tax=Mucilaginibacter straminoryzae TaxID=2932774 RepID=A0A9X2BB31_9SPHI|nr:hypothetical protein [Mucilaginibacter straminoryzae]MCJ8212011.1 hypothetical protein [Mucilaginibacter straminoryzae]
MKSSKSYLWVIFLMMALQFAHAQDSTSLSANDFRKKLKEVINNPDLYNDAFAKLRSALVNKNNFLNDFDLKFKTFQTEGLPPSLGFEYKYDNSWTKVSKEAKFARTFSIDLNGNVAFKHEHNPNDFLESKANYSFDWFVGGHIDKNTNADVDSLELIDSLIIENQGKPAEAVLREKRREYVSMSNMFYLGLNAKASYESNQTFTQQQFAPGLLVNLGFKAWDRHSDARWLNIPDYPFALLRLITGSSKDFMPSRASFPSVLLGIDHVIPTDDALRKAVLTDMKAFERFRFEAAFKTEAAVLDKQVIWFSANYRWFRELGASKAIREADLAGYSYFTCNLASSNGFFVSYTHGRLPFDVKANSTYGLGFVYNLGTWK